MLRFLVFFFIMSWTFQSSAQQYISDLTHYDLKDGLSHNQVKWIHKDRQGLIWLGAANGINRFDGKAFELVANLDFFHAPNYQIIEDWEGDLWLQQAKPNKALIFFNTLTGKVKSLEEKFANKAPFSKHDFEQALALPDNRIAIGLNNGQLIYVNEQQDFEIIQLVPIGNIKPLEVLKDGRHWLMIDTRRSLFEKKATEFLLLDQTGNKIQQFNYNSIIGSGGVGKDDQIFLYSTNQLLELSPEAQVKAHSFPDSLDMQFEVGRISYDAEQDLFWVACNSNLFIFNSDHDYLVNLIEQYDDLEVIQYNYSLLDRDHMFWLGSISGVFKIEHRLNPFQNYLHNNSGEIVKEDFEVTREICTDEHGNIYVNATEKTVQITKEQRIKVLEKGKTKFALTYDKDDGLWTGGDYNFSNFDLSNGTKKTYTSNFDSQSLYVWSFFRDRNKRLWIGSEIGLYYLDDGSEEIQLFDGYNEFEDVAKVINYTFHPDEEGNLWMCTSNGLFKLDIKAGITERYWSGGDEAHYLPSNDLRHLHQDSDGIYWIASNDGLIRWEKEKAKSRLFTTKDGFSHNHVCGVYEDNFGFLWMSSDNGIMQFSKSDFAIKIFLPQDGITHREFNRISHHQAKDGHIYFGGLNGVTSFHPKDFQENFEEQPDFPLQLLGCKLYAEKSNQQENQIAALQRTGKVTMAPNDRYLHLEFALLDYSNSNEIEYAYTLDADLNNAIWNNIKEGALQIGGLSYGEHTITIKGITANGLVSKQKLTIPVEVLKPFYLQNWFLILSGLTFLFTLFLIQKARVRYLLKRQMELEEIVTERTKTIRKQSEKLKALDEAKSKFLANISHEFRTPLTLILNTLNHEEVAQLMNQKDQFVFSKTDIQIMDRNAKRLQQLIEQLLDLSKLESGKMKLETKSGDFKNYLQQLVSSFSPISEKKKIKIGFHIDEADYLLRFDRDKTDKIFYNLLSNALKFTPDEGKVSVELNRNNSFTTIKVTDNGIGIPGDQINYIFDRFYQVKQNDEHAFDGTGIGLSLVKELVQVHGGNIKVNTALDQGVQFILEIPFEKGSPSESIVMNTRGLMPGYNNKNTLESFATEEHFGESEAISSEEEKPILLIIEDNSDLRYHLKKTFEEEYKVLLAKDGKQGVAIAEDQIPNFIICDVMMPQKNGYEVCRHLKLGKLTDHIPILLLTAKAAQEEKLEGLLVGADAYISKPYDPSELKLTIRNFLEQEKRMQKRFSAIDQKPSKELLQTPQNAFILKIHQVIEEHIADGLFGVERLSELMGLSRSQLFRKLKAISGQSPIHLIRSIRLQKAKTLLQQGAGNATEVAYMVGFNNPNYFFKCFKTEFGITAGEWVRQHTVDPS